MSRDDDRPVRRSRDDDDERPARRASRDDDDSPRRGRGRDDDTPRFKYRSRDPEKAQKRAEGGGDFDTYLADAVKMFKAKEGPNTLRFLPPTWDDADHFGIDAWMHFQVGSDQGTYLCLEKMKGKPCPVCEERARAVRSGDEEYAKELRPQHRVIYYVLDRDAPRDGVQAYTVGKRADEDLARLCVDKRSGEVLEIDHPEHGYDYTFTRTGQGLKTRYTGQQIDRRPSSLDNDKALDFITSNPLPEQLRYYSYDHIKKVFGGGGAPKDDDKPARRRVDDDDDAPPARRSSRDDDAPPARGKKPEVEVTWDEVHELSFRKLEALIDEHRLRIDPEATRSDDELADQICEALGISKGRKAKDEDDDPPPRRRVSRDDDDDAPPARRSSKDEDEADSPRTRLRNMRGD